MSNVWDQRIHQGWVPGGMRLCSVVAIALFLASCAEDNLDALVEARAPVLDPVPVPTKSGISPVSWVTLPQSVSLDAQAVPNLALVCGGSAVMSKTVALSDGRIVLNPAQDLPSDAECVVSLFGGDVFTFTTATSEESASVLYDRSRSNTLGVLPDDYFLVEDSTTATGSRISMTGFTALGATEQILLDRLTAIASASDGWSPFSPMVIPVDGAIATSQLPSSLAESVDPTASIAIYDLTPGAATYGQQIPFIAQIRSDTFGGVMAAQHTLSVYPSINYTPQGVYGVVVTRRAGPSASAALEPSEAFQAVLGAAQTGEAAEITQARAITRPMLDAINAAAPIDYDANDVALAVRITIRSVEATTADMIALEQTVRSLPPSTLTITSVTTPDPSENDSVGVMVEGTWTAPEFRNAVTGLLELDVNGAPVQTGTNTVDFFLALPASDPTNAPVVVFGHGNPGDAGGALTVARQPGSDGESLANKGFALISFTDARNRPALSGGQSLGGDANTQNLLQHGEILHYERQGWAETMAFFDTVKGLENFDILPLSGGAPSGDGIPDLDVSELLYYGISAGGHKAFAITPFIPEMRAAAAVVGGTRSAESESMLGQRDAEGSIQGIVNGGLSVAPNELFASQVLAQIGRDKSTPASYGPLAYDAPLTLADPNRASLLVVEGVNDTFVPNNTTRATALAFGQVRHVAPVQQDTRVLMTTDSPVSANVNERTTAGYFQFVPSGVPGLTPTPGCENETDGHVCAQLAPLAVDQIIAFFESALNEPAPVIRDPAP